MNKFVKIALLAIGPNGEFGTKNPENYGIPFNSKTDMKWFRAMSKGGDVITSRDSVKFLPLDKFNDRNIIVQNRNHETVEYYPGKEVNANFEVTKNVYSGGALFTTFRLDLLDYIFVSLVNKLNGDEVTTFMKMEDLLTKGHKVIWAGQTREDISKVDSNRIYILSREPLDVMREEHPELLATVLEHFEPYQKLHVKESLLINKDAHGEAEVKEFIYVPEGYTGIISIRRKLKLYTSGTTLRSRWKGTPQVIVNNRSHQPVELKVGEEIAEIAFVRN